MLLWYKLLPHDPDVRYPVAVFVQLYNVGVKAPSTPLFVDKVTVTGFGFPSPVTALIT